MNKRVKRTWVRALRSGKYMQGSGRLKSTSNVYCCLGVLCEIAIKSKATSAPKIKIRTCWNEVSFDGYTCNLPPKIKEWAGVNFEEEDFLITLNDVKRASFNSVADWIEANL